MPGLFFTCMNTELQRQPEQDRLPPEVTPSGESAGLAAGMAKKRAEQSVETASRTEKRMEQKQRARLEAAMQEEAKEAVISLEDIGEAHGIEREDANMLSREEAARIFQGPDVSRVAPAAQNFMQAEKDGILDGTKSAYDIEKYIFERFNIDAQDGAVSLKKRFFGLFKNPNQKAMDKLSEPEKWELTTLLAEMKQKGKYLQEKLGSNPMNISVKGPARKLAQGLGMAAAIGGAGVGGQQLQAMGTESRASATGKQVEQQLSAEGLASMQQSDKSIDYVKMPIGYEKMQGPATRIESRQTPFVMEPGSAFDSRFDDALKSGKPLKTPFGEVSVFELKGKVYAFIKQDDNRVRAAVYQDGVSIGEKTYGAGGGERKSLGDTYDIDTAYAASFGGTLTKQSFVDAGLGVSMRGAAPVAEKNPKRSFQIPGISKIAELSSDELKTTSGAFDPVQATTGLYQAMDQAGMPTGSMKPMDEYMEEQRERVKKEPPVRERAATGEQEDSEAAQ